jgi:hypothetical protein
MPVSYKILKDIGVIVVRHIGRTDDDEMLNTYRKLLKEPDFELAYPKLVDLRESTSVDRSAGALQALAGLVQKHYSGKEMKSVAAIIAPADLYYGLARMYEALTDKDVEEVRVFRDLSGAVEWLGLDQKAVAKFLE